MKVETVWKRRWHYLKSAVAVGGEPAGLLFGVASLVFGISGTWALAAVLGVSNYLAVAVGALLLSAILFEGGFRLFDNAQKSLLTWSPTWEHLRDRAETLRDLLDVNNQDNWNAFLMRYAASHRAAALSDYDMADTAGFPLSIDREELRRPANPEAFAAIANSFEEAASRWRADEQSS